MVNIIALNNFPIYPPITGGQLWIYYLLKYLARHYPTKIYTIGNYLEKKDTKITINKTILKRKINNFEEFVFSDGLLNYLMKFILCWRVNIIDADIFMSYRYPKVLANYLMKDVKMSEALVLLEHPYLSPILKEIEINIHKISIHTSIIYDAHNVEYLLKKQLATKLNKIWLNRVYEIEKYACEISDAIFVTSNEDKEAFVELYDISEDKLFVIPNGVELDSLKVGIDKEFAKKIFGLEGKTIAIFIGSGHKPNVEAAKFIVHDLAPKLDNLHFLIVGEVCNHINEPIPKNVKLLGIVDNETKNLALKASDIALNPVMKGSGTNVKMVEYMAMGLPIITTPIGARGLEVENWRHLIITERKNFSDVIRYLLSNEDLLKHISKNCISVVREKYNWKVISRRVLKVIRRLFK